MVIHCLRSDELRPSLRLLIPSAGGSSCAGRSSFARTCVARSRRASTCVTLCASGCRTGPLRDLHILPLTGLLTSLDWDPAFLCLFGLRQPQCEDAVSELGLGRIGFHGRRQTDNALEDAVPLLSNEPALALAALLTLLASLATNAYDVANDGDLDVFG